MAISVVAHVAILAIVGFSAPKLRLIELPEHAVAVIILPESLSRRPRFPAPAQSPVQAPARAAAKAGPPKITAPAPAPPLLPAPRAQRAPQPQPAAAPPSALKGASPAQTAGKGPAAPPTQGFGPPPAQGEVNGVQDALRTSVGCDVEDEALLRLSPQERARCNLKVGLAAAKAPQVFGIDPLKRKRFDEQADADERRRQDRTGPLQGAVKACSEVDDRAMATNLGGGCLSSHTTIRPN